MEWYSVRAERLLQLLYIEVMKMRMSKFEIRRQGCQLFLVIWRLVAGVPPDLDDCSS